MSKVVQSCSRGASPLILKFQLKCRRPGCQPQKRKEGDCFAVQARNVSHGGLQAPPELVLHGGSTMNVQRDVRLNPTREQHFEKNTVCVRSSLDEPLDVDRLAQWRRFPLQEALLLLDTENAVNVFFALCVFLVVGGFSRSCLRT